jgi:hypothetical protein
MLKKSICVWLCGLAAALLLLASPGCGGSPSSVQVQSAQSGTLDPATSGTLTVHLVQDGNPGPLSHLNLVLSALEVRVGGVWRAVTLASPGQAIDILAATSQTPLLLASAVPWPVGQNDAIRFSVGPGSNLQLSDEDAETTHALAVPTQFVSTMGLPGSFSVTAQADTDLWIAFGVAHVAQADPDNDGGYGFTQGPIRGYDQAATGAIAGTLTSQAVTGPPEVPAAPLQGAVVTAQLQVADGAPGAAIAFRSVQTDADGNYSLDLLPLGYTWCVVSQPTVAGTVYYPQASQGFALGSVPYNEYQSSLAFPVAALPGSVSGTEAAAPGTGQLDVADLVQAIAVAGVPYDFVLASAVVDGSGSFSFTGVPPGIYTVVLNHYTVSLTQGLLDQPQATAGFVVSSGAASKVSF